MKFTILTSAALLAATAAVAQTSAPGAPGTPGSGGSMTGSQQPGSMPSTESMTTPGDAPGTAGNPAGSAASGTMTEQMARQKFAGAGYNSVTNLKRTPDGQWEAMTRSGGKQQRVTIAPDGTVTPNTQQ